MKYVIKILLLLACLFMFNGLAAQEYAKPRHKKGVSPKEKTVKKEPEVSPVADTAAPATPVDDDFEKLMRLGAKQVGSRKYTDALDTFNKAMTYNRQTGRVLTCRGEAFSGNKDYLNAIKDYTEAIELGTTYDGEVYYSRGICRASLEEPDREGACADFKKAKEMGFTVEGRDVIGMYCD